MEDQKRNRFRNQLLRARMKKSIGQKKVAVLLGHKSSAYLSRYESGEKLPSLKAALKLGLIYNIPIHVLLDGYLEACRNEMKRYEQRINSPGIDSQNVPDEIDYCSFENRLSSPHPSKVDLEKGRSHATRLVRLQAERMDHI